MANPNNVIGGHKANLANPNTSEEAKEHSRQVIDDMETSGEVQPRDEGKNTGNVVGGHKATLKNPNVSEEAKEHSAAVLEDMGVEVDRS